MKEVIVLMTLMFSLASLNFAMPRINYATLRKQILDYEQRFMLGANVSLSDIEHQANKILMNAKKKEFEAGSKNLTKFAPSRNFMLSKKDIDESEVYKFIRGMPKGAVLHTHDTAMVSADYVYHNITFREDLYICETNETFELRFFKEPNKECRWELLKSVRQHPFHASRVNKKIREKLTMDCENPVSTYSNLEKAWSKFSNIFSFLGPMITFRSVYEDHFLMALEELYEDNVMYLELRSTLPTLYDFDGTEYKPKDTLGIYKTLADRFKKDHPDFVGVKVIYAPHRSVDGKQVKEYIKTLKELQELYPTFVAGFDLVGQEDKGNSLEYFTEILTNAAPDTNFFFHAGETNWYGSSVDENLVDAILLNTRRIGHGYALVYHPILLEMTKRMNIAIEVNPISNQVLKLVDDMRNHAARRLFSEGYPVVVSNDDPGFWNARALSYDFYEAFMGLMSEHSDLRGLKQLAMNSLIYSSMDDEEKKAALSLWENKWMNYANDVTQKSQ